MHNFVFGQAAHRGAVPVAPAGPAVPADVLQTMQGLFTKARNMSRIRNRLLPQKYALRNVTEKCQKCPKKHQISEAAPVIRSVLPPNKHLQPLQPLPAVANMDKEDRIQLVGIKEARNLVKTRKTQTKKGRTTHTTYPGEASEAKALYYMKWFDVNGRPAGRNGLFQALLEAVGALRHCEEGLSTAQKGQNVQKGQKLPVKLLQKGQKAAKAQAMGRLVGRGRLRGRGLYHLVDKT